MIIVGFFAGIICAFFIAKWAKKEWIKKGHGTAVSTLGSVSLGICTFIMFLVASIVMSSKSDVSDQAQQTSVSEQNPASAPIEEKQEEVKPVKLSNDFLQQVKTYDSSILDARLHGDKVLEIDLKATEVAFSDVGYLDTSARQARDILIKILKNNPDEKFDVVRFVTIATLTDKYNNNSEHPIFQIVYDYPEVKKVNLDDDYIDHRIFLNFAKFSVRHPIGGDLYQDWCLKDDNVQRSGNFCS